MKENDPERLAIDSIAQFVYSLPTEYKAGFAAYSTEITAEQPPVAGEERSRIMDAADRVEYKGYSNAGAGLSLAAEYLKGDAAGEKHVVLLSDGEILMEQDPETEESLRMYQDAAREAEEAGIRVHVIGLGSGMEDMDNAVFEAARLTGGRTYYTPQALDIQSAIDSILEEELRIRQSTLAIVDAGGDTQTVSAELPYVHADKVRVLLTSTAPIRNLGANFQADSASQVNGERYSLIELKEPYGTKLDISFTGTQGSQIRINAIPEYRVMPKAEVTYTDVVPEEEDALSYCRTAEIVYSFYDLENQDVQLWTDDYFEHKKISILVGDEEETAVLSAGTITFPHIVSATEELWTEIDYSGLPVNVTGVNGVKLALEGPAALPQEEEEEPPYALAFAAAGLMLAVFAMALFLHWHRPKNQAVPAPREEKPEPGRYSYAGKLNIYVTRTPSGYDIPPLSYNLFRLPEGRVISLGEVLERCGVTERFAGAETIYFKAGANRSLIMTNNSDGTVMKNREIVMKKKSILLLPEEKVDITFEDEIGELMFQYKELMPSER